METLDPRIAHYIESVTRFVDPLLSEMEARAQREGFPIIGPHVGPWLHFLTRLTGARRVYELGSGYGYSTWFFARAVAENLAQSGGAGELVHTVWDSQLSADARANLDRAGFSSLLRYIDGEAVAALRLEEPGWDIIFMDIDKEGYPAALDVIQQKLRPGGLLIVDNLIWSGTVADESDQRPSTLGIRELTRRLRESPDWELLILPLRDGVGIARWRG